MYSFGVIVFVCVWGGAGWGVGGCSLQMAWKMWGNALVGYNYLCFGFVFGL